MTQTYDDHVIEALDDVSTGQHLRFINYIYRTKEVCLAAVKFESTHTSVLADFGSVPMGNLDYVKDNMTEIMKDDTYYLDNMERAYLERKEQERSCGYYGNFETLQDKFAHYKITNNDEMFRKLYDLSFNSK